MSTPPSRRSNLLFLLLGGLSVAIVAAVLGLSGVFDGSSGGDGAAGAAATPAAAAPPAASGGAPTSVADIYERVSTGVVFVSATTAATARPTLPSPGDGPGGPGGPGDGGSGTATGSGFVIDMKGNIVTNQHVVDDARNVRVRFGEDGDPIPARIVGEDPSSDLAVLKVDPKDVEGGLKPIALGDSKRLRPGEATIAIGAPFGLAGSVTTGIVSALGREIQSPNGFPISGVIQTDAAINPGNSGGPLLDAQGRAIGVNSQIATNGQSGSNSGVGFAVPIDTVKEVVPILERDGKIERPYLGVSTSDATGSSKGAVVRAVVPGTPAARAGLRVGDRITAVDGKPVSEAADVSATIGPKKPGDRVRIAYVRGGAERTATVTLGTRPDEASR